MHGKGGRQMGGGGPVVMCDELDSLKENRGGGRERERESENKPKCVV